MTLIAGSLTSDALTGGFENPVLDAQAVFRALMDAMARPGSIHHLGYAPDAPSPFSPAQGAVALCLADHDTPVWLSPALRAGALPGWLAFQCGALVTQAMADGRFAFFASSELPSDFSGFAMGSQDYPDRSATLILELPALVGGVQMRATGPGIEGEAIIAPSGLPADFIRRWAANRGLFPRGIDLILTAGRGIMCLPRSAVFKPVEM